MTKQQLALTSLLMGEEQGEGEILRGICPERYEILRFAQDDTKRTVHSDTLFHVVASPDAIGTKQSLRLPRTFQVLAMTRGDLTNSTIGV